MSRLPRTVLIDPSGVELEHHINLHITEVLKACQLYVEAQRLRNNNEAIYDEGIISWDYWHPHP
jgi:hypothetical protein